MSVLEEFGMDVFYFYTAPADFPISGRIVQEGMEIVEVITDGEVLFDYKGRMERFGRGWIFWQQAGDYTVHISVPGNPYSCIAFQLVAFQKRIVQRVSRWNDLATLDEFIRKVLSMRQAPNCRVEVLEQLFRAELMQHAYLWEQSKEAKEHPQLLTKAMDVIMDQLSKDISVEEIALKSGASVSSLFHLFRKHLGISPHKWRREKRLARAEMLLRTSNYNIKEIVHKCGFESTEGFYRAFRDRSGVSPGNYRELKIL